MTTPPPAPPAASCPATLAFEDFVRALDSVLSREISDIEALIQRSAQGLSGNRDAGLGWALDERLVTRDALTRLRADIVALLPHEPTVRAILARAA